MPRNTKFTLPILLLGTLAVASCVTTAANRKALILVPDSQMNALGVESYKTMLSKAKVSTDAAVNETVLRIGRRIAAASGKKYQWEFKVIDDETVNAFCLPGGKVAVYMGIIPVAKTEAGLAAIIGHEVAHAVLRHGAERVSQQMVAKLGLSAADLTFQNNKHRSIIMGGLGLGAQVGVLLPYSRKHESEADKIGLQYMAKAGYDPREAEGLWKRMAQVGGGQRPPELLSTHPDPMARAAALKRAAAAADIVALYQASEKQPSRDIVIKQPTTATPPTP